MRENSNSTTRALPRVSVVLAAMALVGVMATASGAADGDTTRVSVDSSENQANNYSYYPSISADGRYVAFVSKATNLVPNDTNGADDVFVRDRRMGTVERVSVDSSGDQANRFSLYPSISADGRFVAFVSRASNLVPNDTNERTDVFVHDRQVGITQRVSVDSSGNQGNWHSGESSWYHSSPSISAHGRYVAFRSHASNLVPNDTGTKADIFVRDRQTRTTELVSADSSGKPGNRGSDSPSISSNGRFVAFWSGASNLVPKDDNLVADIFVRDRQSGTTERVSVGLVNTARPSISAGGRFVAFESNGHDIFVRDRQTDTTELVSVDSSGNPANSWGGSPSISAGGRFVAFHSEASNLVPNDTNGEYDIFVRDRQTGITRRVSVSSSGKQANGLSHTPSISAEGRYVAFYSDATNLVPNDTNNQRDVFAHDLGGATAP